LYKLTVYLTAQKEKPFSESKITKIRKMAKFHIFSDLYEKNVSS